MKKGGAEVPEEFLSPYNSTEQETKLYAMWENSGYFNPDNLPSDGAGGRGGEPFTVIMPPPNANGSLHIGHALFVALEDVMIRYARMRGRKALWVPGADHAGFETQIVYERSLKRRGGRGLRCRGKSCMTR